MMRFKKYIACSVFLLFAYGVFANGQMDNGKINVKNNTTGQKISFNAKNKLNIGTYEIQVNMTDNTNKIKYVIVKKENKWYDVDGIEVELADIVAQLTAAANKQPGEISFTRPQTGGGEDLVVMVDTTAKTSTGTVQISEQERKRIEIKDGVPVLKGNLSGGKQNYSVFFIYANNSFINVDFVANTSFFPNEDDVFTALYNFPANTPYKTKALTFMSLFFNDHAKFSEMAQTYFDVTIPPKSSLQSGNQLVKNAMSDFRRIFGLHFSNINYEKVEIHETPRNANGLPYFVFDSNMFNSLYSMGQNGITPNVYISAYLLYSCEKEIKPLLSYFLREGLPNSVSYDYKKFKKISADDGKSLAKAALRYLTWGVEYTPYPTGGIETGFSGNKVFQLNREMIQDWVNNYETSRTPLDNYLPNDIVFNPVTFPDQENKENNKKIHVLNGDWYGRQLSLIGNMNTGNTKMKLSRVDLWSSANIAWEQNRISQIIKSGQVENLSAENQKFFDKRIYTETGNNIDIPRLTTGNKELSFGYRFTNEEQVGAILLVRGKTENVLNGNKPIEKKIEIKYGENSSNYQTINLKKNQNKFANCLRSREKVNATPGDDKIAVRTKIPGNSPFYAFDNNYGTYWRSYSVSDPYMEMVLEKPIIFSRIRICWGDETTKTLFVRSKVISVRIQLFNNNNRIDNIQNPFILGNSGLFSDIALGQEYSNVNRMRFEFATNDNVQVVIKEIELLNRDNHFFELANYKGTFYANGIEWPDKNSCHLDFLFNTNSEVTADAEANMIYNYIIFSKPVTCREIKINYPAGDGVLHLSEVLIFPENPVKHYIDDYVLPQNKLTIQETVSSGKSLQPSTLLQGCEFTTLNNEDINTISLLSNTRLATVKEFSPVTKNDVHLSAIQYTFRNPADIKQMVLWEQNASGPGTGTSIPDTVDFKREIIALCDFPFNDMFFTNQEDYYSRIKQISDANKLTTPFYRKVKESGSSNEKIISAIGNPLPYAPLGIDTPRTFNYKMYEQVESAQYMHSVRIETSSSARADSEEKYMDYTNEADLFRVQNIHISADASSGFKYDQATYENNLATVSTITHDESTVTLKPFMPGLLLNSKEAYVKSAYSPYSPDKSAGVDAVGLLSGSLSMCDFEESGSPSIKYKIVDSYNYDTRQLISEYNKMQNNSITQQIAKKDGAVSETVTLKGLDINKKPVFYSNNNSFLDTPYRFTRADIERSTVIIPRLVMMQEGDLLVKTDDENEIHIGIIVRVPENISTLDEEKILEQTLVISVRRGMQMVTIGVWGNPQGMFGGFAEDPKEYHIRRLLKIKETDYTGMTAKYKDSDCPWELVSYSIKELKVDISLPLDRKYPGQKNHFVPNTGEYFGDFLVKIKGVIEYNDLQNSKKETLELPLPDSQRDIQLLSPRDRFFSEGELSIPSNINSNKGDGIEFCFRDNAVADFSDASLDNRLVNDPYIWLVRFRRKEYIASGTGRDNSYDIEYNENYYAETINGVLKNTDSLTCRLFVDEDDRLTFSIKENGNVEQIRKRFAVRPISTNIRPGDDFILRFCLLSNKEKYGPSESQNVHNTLAGAPDESYPGHIVIYDKKLLWRANLYIVEGNNDWNDLNPWNAPPASGLIPQGGTPGWWSENYGFNEWNRTDMGAIRVADWNNLPAGNGGQVITFRPWTRYNGELFAGHEADSICYKNGLSLTVTNAVAYAIGSLDSPFAFKREIIEQSLYNGTNITTAPGTWLTYSPDDDMNGNYERIDNVAEQYAITQRNGGFPYRPNYSAIERYDFDNYIVTPHTFVSSGVDCSSFITRLTTYLGNKYLLPKWNSDRIENNWLTGPGMPTAWIGDFTNRYSDILFSETRNNQADLLLINMDARIARAVPGDIITMYDPEDNSWPHVMMIQNVGDTNNDGQITTDEIVLIESASGWGTSGVLRLPNGQEIQYNNLNSADFHRKYRVMSGQWYKSYRNNPYAFNWTYYFCRLRFK